MAESLENEAAIVNIYFPEEMLIDYKELARY